MKKAFTMLELVFVIVVVGILSYFAASSFQRNPLREAADQLVSHIRYTQHLAMQDDKFRVSGTNSQHWFRERWQIRFHRTVDENIVWSYSIFSDNPDYGGEPDEAELAKNPLNSAQYLTGGFSGGVIDLTSSKRMQEMALGTKYGVQSVTFSASCTNNQGINQSRRISFDYLGRPFYSDLSNQVSWTSPYQADKIIQSRCSIVLSDGTSTITIAIEPETGYTHIQ